MAVLAEGISVVIRCDRLLAAFEGDWDAFKAIVPNKTLCADNELVRIGFMVPADVKEFNRRLAARGLTYLSDGAAQDLVVVDQMRGPMVPCDWIEFGQINLDGDPKQRVSACRLAGSTQTIVIMPEGWIFGESLSSTFGFVPNGQSDKSLTFLRHQDGMEVYRNRLTGKEVFIGRTSRHPDC
jgi:hypothetical protein